MGSTSSSFSKKINEAQFLERRLQNDASFLKNKLSDSILPYISWELNEDTVKLLVYNDFFERTRSILHPLSIYIGPRIDSSIGVINSKNILQSYNDDIALITRQLNRLGILHHTVSQYDEIVWESLSWLDKRLVENHRVWLRSDVVYYDITTGKVVPDHRIEIQNLEEDNYILKFFLQWNNDTIPVVLQKIYELFACVAILVNPHDKRYKKARGRDVIIPIINKAIPVISYEGVSIENLWTRLLIPTHNRDDFKIALELGLPTDVYAYDKLWKFTSRASFEFQWKSILWFSENIVKFLEDISNLESTHQRQQKRFFDRSTGRTVYPLLEKNMYIGLGQVSRDHDDFLSKETSVVGDSTALESSILLEEDYCISNQDTSLISLAKFWWQFSSFWGEDGSNLFQDLVKDFVISGLLQLPAKWDAIINCFSLQFQWKLLWRKFLERRTKEFSYPNVQNIVQTIENCISHDFDEALVDQLLDHIDLWWSFVFTAKGYILSDYHRYHYDNDYIALAYILAQSKDKERITISMMIKDALFFKYFFYLYYFTIQKPLTLDIDILQSAPTSWVVWSFVLSDNADVSRIYFLQSLYHNDQDHHQWNYTLDEIYQFLMKRWNFCRIVVPCDALTLEEIQEQLRSRSQEMHDYDTYIITTLHDLYDEVKFLLQKRDVTQATKISIQTLRYKVIDILLYIVKLQPSAVSNLVAWYVVVFSNHLLYPFAPTTINGLFENLGIQRSSTFFENDPTFVIEKNIKCNFLMQFVTQRYKEIKKQQNIQWFILKANKDFLDYAKKILPDFQNLFWNDYTIEFLDEYQERPEHVAFQKVFAMQWGVILREQENLQAPRDKIEESLGMLKKQLLYKEQLLQTIKNTLMRVRTSAKEETLLHYQQQIKSLEQEILVLEYQISKLKYF